MRARRVRILHGVPPETTPYLVDVDGIALYHVARSGGGRFRFRPVHLRVLMQPSPGGARLWDTLRTVDWDLPEGEEAAQIYLAFCLKFGLPTDVRALERVERAIQSAPPTVAEQEAERIARLAWED
jgi:hypothetical protein